MCEGIIFYVPLQGLTVYKLSSVMKRIYLIVVLSVLMSSVAYSQTYKELYEKSVDYIECDSLEKAENMIQQAIRLEPTNERNALLYSNLGFIYTKKNKLEQAAGYYTKAINLLPKTVNILLARASVYMQLGMIDSAYNDYLEVIVNDVKNKEAMTMKAYIDFSRRDYTKSKESYNSLLKWYPDDYNGMLGLALVEQKEKHYEKASSILSSLIYNNPTDAKLYLARAEVEYERGVYELAVEDCNKAIELDNKYVQAIIMRIKVNTKRNKNLLVKSDMKRLNKIGISSLEVKELLKDRK